MSDFRGNIDHWIRQSEPDYYIFFLKAWIPFNAWYVAEMPQHKKNDAIIIRELQDNNNSKPRNIIENYIIKDNFNAVKFKSHLAELHYCLESKTIKHNSIKLSFSNLPLSENPKKFEKDLDIQGNIYKAEVKQGFLQALIVDKGGKTFLDYKKSQFDIEDLKKNNDFIKIADKKIQTKIIKCYEAINPDKPLCLVSNSKTKGDYILLLSESKVHFINDPTTIAKACIKVLYTLRCMLFHGEIEPTNSNKPIYEHAYYLLRLLIKELH